MGNEDNEKSNQKSWWVKLPKWANFIIALIGVQFLSTFINLIFQKIGLVKAFLKLPLLIWTGLLFEFENSVWLYVLSASLPFVIYYICLLVIRFKNPKWLNYQLDVFYITPIKEFIRNSLTTPETDAKDTVLFRWEYKKTRGRYDIKNLTPLCQICSCILEQKDEQSLICPICGDLYKRPKGKNFSSIKKIIEQKIRTGTYKKSKHYKGKQNVS